MSEKKTNYNSRLVITAAVDVVKVFATRSKPLPSYEQWVYEKALRIVHGTFREFLAEDDD